MFWDPSNKTHNTSCSVVVPLELFPVPHSVCLLLFFVLHGQYLNTHPGGVDLIVDEAGSDATEAFEDIGHGPEAREILAQHVIGYVPNYDPEKFAAAKVSVRFGLYVNGRRCLVMTDAFVTAETVPLIIFVSLSFPNHHRLHPKASASSAQSCKVREWRTFSAKVGLKGM